MRTEAISRRRTYVPQDQRGIVDFAAFLRGSDRKVATARHRLVSPDGKRETAVPDEIFEALTHIVDQLSAGRAVSVIPLDSQITSQDAADFLGCSRPTLVKLLELGQIPHTKVGRHRRVMLQDLVVYEESEGRQRREFLNHLSREAAEDGSVFVVPDTSKTR